MCWRCISSRLPQFDLCFHRQLADFVQKQGSAVGEFKAPDAPVDRAGEGAFEMAEQFAFDEPGRDCTTIDFDQRTRAPGAAVTNSARSTPIAAPQAWVECSCRSSFRQDKNCDISKQWSFT
jgi:hypothetical protein